MKLAVIVPYRDRAEHLKVFLPAMGKFLFNVEHRIHVIEQGDRKPFNRGKLLNVGYAVALELEPATTHVVLHDVDMLPEAVRYLPVEVPTHLAGAAEQFGYALPYAEYFGGVTLFPVPTFAQVNGYNNDYWGWGCEDDDLLDRCKHHAVSIAREAGRFRSLPHTLSLNLPANKASYSANIARLRTNRSGQIEYATNGLSTLEYRFKNRTGLGNGAVLTTVEL